MPAIILAAGASRRLGRAKQLVPIHGQALLVHTLNTAQEAGACPVLVVLGANSESIVSSVDLSGVQVIANPQWQDGISTSIRAGLDALVKIDPSAQAVLLLVCDQPLLDGEHLRRLIATYNASGSGSIVASRYAEVVGIPAIFPASQFATLQSLKGDTGARQILRAPQCPMITVPFEGGELDIDTPDDLKRLN